ncbi:MAG: ATP-binding cassette domain-containing protein, partial [Mycoplasmataceae bacterium]|nr:ATP-binding cassette domain-containing protein [Mycoplasmataceae bacterium]
MSNKMNEKKTLIQVNNLTKYYISSYGAVKAIDNVSFDLKEGEIVGLIGQSGSGKSTIANALMKMTKEVNGVVYVNGRPILGKMSKKETKIYRQDIQMIFQDPHTSLNEKRNIFSTIAEPLLTNKIIKKDVKEFAKNEKDVQDMFELTFKMNYKKAEFKHVKNKYNIENSVIDEMKENMDSFDKTKFKDNDKAISELMFAYYNPIEKGNATIVNSLAESKINLTNGYKKALDDYKERNIPSDEADLINTREELRRLSLEMTKAKGGYGLFLKKNNNAANKEIKKQTRETHLFIFDYINDQKKVISFRKQLASISKTKKEYIYQKEKALLAKTTHNALKRIATVKLILTRDEVEQLNEFCSRVVQEKNVFALIEKEIHKLRKLA